MANQTHQGWQLFIITLPGGGSALGIGKNLESVILTLEVEGADVRPVTQEDIEQFRESGELPGGIFIAFRDLAN